MQNSKLKETANDLIQNPKAKYTVQDLDKVFELLDKNTSPQDIVDQVENLTARQIKFIRFIKERGTQLDIKLLYTCKFFISRIKSQIQLRNLNKKG